MNKIYSLLLGLSFLLATLMACNEEQALVVPSDIENLTAEPREGAVLLRWTIPAGSNYLYVQLEYQHPVSGKLFYENASIYRDTLLVSGLLAKDGEIDFRMKTFSATSTISNTVESVRCKALPVQPRTEKFSEKVELKADMLSTNAQEPSGYPISDLVDGLTNNFFHTAWTVDIPVPHWFDIALPEPLDMFEFVTWYRGGRFGTAPTEIAILGSDDKKTWELITTLYDGGEGKTQYTSPVIECEKKYAYIRYRADSTPSGTFFALAELTLNKVWLDIYDPEGIYGK